MYTRDDYRRPYIRDEADPRLNWSTPAPVNYKNVKAHPDDAGPPNGQVPETHVHIHSSIDELALPDHEERLATIEQALLRLIREAEGEGGVGSKDGATNGSQAGSSRVRHGPSDESGDPGDYQMSEAGEKFTKGSRDAIPSAEDINRANEAYWSSKGHTTTGGSGSLPPNSKAASGGGYLPNQAGSVDQPRLLSTTNRSLTPGKTFGVTQDALRQGQFYRQQRLAANQQIAGIQAKLKAAYKRGA